MKNKDKRRIIINIESNKISDKDAMKFVNSVIAKGRISKSQNNNTKTNNCYCLTSTFKQKNYNVYVEANISNTGNDIFNLTTE